MAQKNRQFILASRPVGLPTPEDVPLAESEIPEPGEGEILVRNFYMSLDPAIRGWMSDAPSYMPPIRLGAPVRTNTIGRVLSSHHPAHKEGDLVIGMGSWADYTVRNGDLYAALPDSGEFPLTYYFSVLGHIGFAAYFGLLDVGQPKAGETVLVSAAAGATGSLVGQIAKIEGCRAVGLAGSEAKCRRLTDEFNFDATINYRTAGSTSGGLVQAIADACPNGVDVYFDNVGGDILDAALMNINIGARIPICGAIASYNATEPVPGPYNLWQLVAKSARMEGFLSINYADRFSEARRQMGQWLHEGRLKQREEIIDGLENALTAFCKLFDGSNQGKLIIKIADE